MSEHLGGPYSQVMLLPPVSPAETVSASPAMTHRPYNEFQRTRKGWSRGPGGAPPQANEFSSHATCRSLSLPLGFLRRVPRFSSGVSPPASPAPGSTVRVARLYPSYRVLLPALHKALLMLTR